MNTDSRERPHCCWDGCPNDAEWRIRHGAEPCDYTESCTEHVGPLLTDAPEHRIYPVTAPLLEGVRPKEMEEAKRAVRRATRDHARRN